MNFEAWGQRYGKQVDQIVRQATQYGAVKTKTLNEEWGYSVTLKDPDGHHWEIVFNAL